MYSPHFSRAAIQKLEGVIHAKITKLLNALHMASQESKVVDLTLAFKCLTADVVMEYCYQRNFGALDATDFHFKIIEDMEGLFGTASYTWYFPNTFNLLCRILEHAPVSVTKVVAKPLAASFEIYKGCQERIATLQRTTLDPSVPSIFQTALLPEPKKGRSTPALKELTADALVFFGAGTDTTAHALATGTWYLLQNPAILTRLRQELCNAIVDADSSTMLSWVELEKLPFLRAVIKESLRLSFGVPGRLPRVVPENGAVFCGQEIPPNTVISHSAYAYHMSDQYFPEAKAFKPDRWLGPGSVERERYMLSFSAGSRGCLGINLAYAELFTTFAYLFRKFDLEVFNTTEHDINWHDCYTPATFGHLKVRLNRVVGEKQ
ncbi:hypothetical protein, variant [Exophiala sideris]|nr:hypothetical protein, variant [Exophiala sideris]